MGADFDSIIIEAKTEDELRKKYNLVQEDRAWDYGHRGYTGTFAEAEEGLIIKGGLWEHNDAEENCKKNHEKWTRAWAYRLKSSEFLWIIGAWCSS